MKRLIVCGAAILALSACKSGWSSAEKEQFKSTCNSGFSPTIGVEKAKDFCDCFEEKVEKKYASKAEADKATQAEVEALSKECIK